jgi:hypothetical protein
MVSILGFNIDSRAGFAVRETSKTSTTPFTKIIMSERVAVRRPNSTP